MNAQYTQTLVTKLKDINTPISTKELTPLTTGEALETCVRVGESLFYSDSIVVPLTGPALEVVALHRWFGEAEFRKLLDIGAIRFAFRPGVVAYVSERNIRALGLKKSEPGVELIAGVGQEWNSPYDAVARALQEQLDMKGRHARRIATSVQNVTTVVDTKKLFDECAKTILDDADIILDDCGVHGTDWNRLDNTIDKAKVDRLLSISSASLDLLLAAELGCGNLHGDEMLWTLLSTRRLPELLKYYPSKGQVDLESNLSRMLELESLPDIPEMIKNGLSGEQVAKIRTDPKCTRFRQWLREQSEDGTDIIKAYYETFKSPKTDRVWVKTLRYLFGQIPALGILTSALDSFWGDKVVNGWNPRVFLYKHFKPVTK